MIYVSHALDEVARLADEIVVLRDGCSIAQGSVFDLLTRIEDENDIRPDGRGARRARRNPIGPPTA